MIKHVCVVGRLVDCILASGCVLDMGATLDPWWKAYVGAGLSPESEHSLLTGLNSGSFEVVDVLDITEGKLLGPLWT